MYTKQKVHTRRPFRIQLKLCIVLGVHKEQTLHLPKTKLVSSFVMKTLLVGFWQQTLSLNLLESKLYSILSILLISRFRSVNIFTTVPHWTVSRKVFVVSIIDISGTLDIQLVIVNQGHHSVWLTFLTHLTGFH